MKGNNRFEKKKQSKLTQKEHSKPNFHEKEQKPMQHQEQPKESFHQEKKYGKGWNS